VFKFLKNHYSTILIVVSIVVALVAWLKPYNFEHRAIEFSVLQGALLVPTSDLNTISFIYNDEILPNLITTEINIKNSGSVPFTEEDFVKGLQIDFPDDVRVIDFEINKIQPKVDISFFMQDLYIERVDVNSLNFSPILFNQGDIYKISVVSTRENLFSSTTAYLRSEINFLYEIFGVSRIEERDEIKTNYQKQSDAREDLGDLIFLYSMIGCLVLLIGVWAFYLLKTERGREVLSKHEAREEKDWGDYFAISFLILMFGFLLYKTIEIVYLVYFLEI